MAQEDGKTRDLTRGGVGKLIFVLALPLLAGNIVQQLYGFVDALMVGRFLGVDALAAIGCTGSLTFLVNNFMGGLTYGFSIYTGQRFGAKDFDGVRQSVLVSMTLALIISLIVALLGVIFCRAILVAMHTPPELLDGASVYILLMVGFITVFSMMNMQACLIRALGNNKIPTQIYVTTLVANIILDPLAIIVLDLGIAGAAGATIISQLIGCAVFFYHTKKDFPLLALNFSRENLKFDKEIILEHLKMGFPMGFQASLIAVGGGVLQIALNKLGAMDVASVVAAQRLEGITLMIFLTFAESIAAFTAQNYGAERFDRIIEGVKKCLAITCGVSFIVSAFNIFAGPEILKIFVGVENPQVLEQGAYYLLVNGVFYWLLAVMLVLKLTLQGLGKNTAPTLSGSMELVTRVLIALFLVDQIGYLGVCLANPLSFFAACIPLVIAVSAERRKILELLGQNYVEESSFRLNAAH